MRIREDRDLGIIDTIISAAAQAGMAVYQRQVAKKLASDAKEREKERAAAEAAEKARAESDMQILDLLFQKKRLELQTAQAQAQEESRQESPGAGPSTLTIVSIVGGGMIIAGVAAYLILGGSG